MRNVNLYYRLLILNLICFISSFFYSCKENNDGIPVINSITDYVDVGNNAPLDGAFPGTIVLINGENLLSVNKITFNGCEAYINAPFVTDTHIVITIPANAPTDASVEEGESVSNEVVLYSDAGKASMPFKLLVPEPKITHVNNEFLHAGKECVIYGSYLYKINKIILPDGIEVLKEDIFENTDEELHFIMPEGVGKGKIKLINDFGEDESLFMINDDTYRLMDFDNVVNTGGLTGCVGTEENGNKYYFHGGNELQIAWRLNACPNTTLTPDFLQGKDLTKGYLKFEFKSSNPLKDDSGKCYVLLQLTSHDGGEQDNPTYNWGGNGQWKPYLLDEYVETGFHEAEWKTISIPLSGFTGMTTINYFGRLVFYLNDVPADTPSLDWAIDNIRFSFPDEEEDNVNE